MNKTLELAVQHSQQNLNHVLEFEVFRGKTVTQLRDSFSTDVEVFGFDSFVGLPEDWTGTTLKAGDLSAGYIPKIQDVTIYDGWFTETIRARERRTGS